MILTRRELFKMLMPWRPGSPPPPVPDGGAAIPGRFTLETLRFLPAAVLGKMVPVRREGWTVTVRDDGVAYRREDGREGLVPLGPEACAAVRQFDGQATLDQIAGALQTQWGWPSDRCRTLVRETFLDLAAREIFHPSGPPSDG